jgi:GT2 family glycosyltransferase
MVAKESRAPNISVIIPVYNGAAFLKSCLQAVAASGYRSYECILVDDGSTDGSRAIAAEFPMPVRIVDISDGPRGPAYARNRGVEAARGAILFFLDADIVLSPGALGRVANLFQERTDVAAVFGSYDSRPAAAGVVSRYRNLLHHFVHQNGNREASTFWAGCGAIRRAVFQQIGGFDEKRFSHPSIEDIELGYRLRQSGYRILLDNGLQGTHLKSWNLYSLIQTDVACRAIPWSRLILDSHRAPDDLNLKLGQRLSVTLVGLAVAFLALALVRSEFLLLSLVAFLGVVLLNRKLYTFFLCQHGVFFAAVCIPLHFLYYLYGGLSYLFVWAVFRLKGAAVSQSTSPWKFVHHRGTAHAEKIK